MSDSAVTVLVAGLVQVTVIVSGFLTLWVKLKYGVEEAKKSASLAATKALDVEKKIDDNTAMTQIGTHEAAINAKAAVVAAVSVSDKVDNIEERLSNNLDTKIRYIIKDYIDPLTFAIREHSEQDEKNMREIRKTLDELRNMK